MESPPVLDESTQLRARKRFSFGGFRGNSTQISSDQQRSVSISSPMVMDDKQKHDFSSKEVPNTIYNNQKYAEQKRISYALCQSLTESLLQLSSNVVMENGQILTVPTLVVKCCDYILNHEMLEGLFRINASIKKMKQLETLINGKLELHQDFEFDDLVSMDDEITDVNSYDVSMVLKRYLNNLEDFLVDHESYHMFVKNHELLNEDVPRQPKMLPESLPSLHSIKSESNSQFSHESNSSISTVYSDTEQQEESLLTKSNIEQVIKSDAKDLSKNIVTQKLHLLTYFLYFLHKLTYTESIVSKTKMSSLNLSKIFQPSLFEFKVEKQSSTENLLDFYKTNELILWRWIDNFDFLDNCMLQELELKKNLQRKNAITHKPTPVLRPPHKPHLSSVSEKLLPTKVKSTSTRKVSAPADFRPKPSITTQVSDLNISTGKPTPTPKPQLKVDVSSTDLAGTRRTTKTVLSAEEKKLRRRTIFGYRSVSSPSAFDLPSPSPITPASANTVGGKVKSATSEVHTKSKLKRLSIFGSSYSLKSKSSTAPDIPLTEPVPAHIAKSSRIIPVNVENSPYTQNPHIIPVEMPVLEKPARAAKKTRQSKRFSFMSSSLKKEPVYTPEPSFIDMSQQNIGLQRKPLVAHEMAFNHSPGNSPVIEHTKAF